MDRNLAIAIAGGVAGGGLVALGAGSFWLGLGVGVAVGVALYVGLRGRR